MYRVLIITSEHTVKKHFLVGKPRFFVDNSVQKVWITGWIYVDICTIPRGEREKLFQKIFPYSDDISCSHGNEEVAGPAVLL